MRYSYKYLICLSIIAALFCSIGSCTQTKKTEAASLPAPAQGKAGAPQQLAPQTLCPVMGNAIDTTLYVDYQGKRIFVCCGGCIAEVKKNPEKYLKKLESMGQMARTIGK